MLLRNTKKEQECNFQQERIQTRSQSKRSKLDVILTVDNTTKKIGIHALPDSVMLMILRRLDLETLAFTASIVCRRWRELSIVRTLWNERTLSFESDHHAGNMLGILDSAPKCSFLKLTLDSHHIQSLSAVWTRGNKLAVTTPSVYLVLRILQKMSPLLERLDFCEKTQFRFTQYEGLAFWEKVYRLKNLTNLKLVLYSHGNLYESVSRCPEKGEQKLRKIELGLRGWSSQYEVSEAFCYYLTMHKNTISSFTLLLDPSCGQLSKYVSLAALCPNLRTLTVPSSPNMGRLKQCKNLSSLYITRLSLCSNNSLIAFLRSAEMRHSLTHLTLSIGDQQSHRDRSRLLRVVAELKNLQTLSLLGVAGLTKAQTRNRRDVQSNARVLSETVKGLPALVGLDLDSTVCTEALELILKETAPGFRLLSFSKSSCMPFTEDGASTCCLSTVKKMINEMPSLHVLFQRMGVTEQCTRLHKDLSQSTHLLGSHTRLSSCFVCDFAAKFFSSNWKYFPIQSL